MTLIDQRNPSLKVPILELPVQKEREHGIRSKKSRMQLSRRNLPVEDYDDNCSASSRPIERRSRHSKKDKKEKKNKKHHRKSDSKAGSLPSHDNTRGKISVEDESEFVKDSSLHSKMQAKPQIQSVKSNTKEDETHEPIT